MSNLSSLTIAELERAVEIKQQIEALRQELESLNENGVALPGKPGRKKWGMSLEGRARVIAAQKARWAKVRGETVEDEVTEAPVKTKKRRKMSEEVKAKIGAAAKARWAKVKGEKAGA